jgi:2-methylcitrate dehydratase PrpD
MAELNGDQAPSDPALANYSIPFSLACAMTGPAADPASFDPSKLADKDVQALSRRVEVVSDGRKSHSDWMTRTVLRLRDGRVLEREVSDFPGTPSSPLTPEQLRERFLIMAGADPESEMLFDRLLGIEHESRIDWIH